MLLIVLAVGGCLRGGSRTPLRVCVCVVVVVVMSEVKRPPKSPVSISHEGTQRVCLGIYTFEGLRGIAEGGPIGLDQPR